jgi:hypothetical protein
MPMTDPRSRPVIRRASRAIPLGAAVAPARFDAAGVFTGVVIGNVVVAGPGDRMIALRYLDIVILILALPIFLAADLPMLGYAAAAVAWVVQRAIQIVLMRKAAAAEDPRTVVGITAGSMIGRGWLVALTIFAAGMVDNDAGLAAAVLVIVLFTAYFTVSMIMRPFDQPPPEQPA